MTESKKDVIKISFIYFLELILTILSTLAITSVMSNIIAFIPNIVNTNNRNLAVGILGGIVEIIIFFVIFYNFFYNNKNSNIKVSVVSFCIALILQFILSWINRFFPYTAGSCVTYLGEFFYFYISGTYDPKTGPSEIPVIYFIIPLILFDILLICLVYISFILAKRKANKEKEKLKNGIN